MSAFEYADTDDEITQQLIASEYDEHYWTASEDRVIARMEDFAADELGFERIAQARMLDLGCGVGRLIPRFAMRVRQLIALEPDEERAAEAAELVCDHHIGNAHVVCSDGSAYLAEHPAEAGTFNIVLCSHVIQHVSHATAHSILNAAACLLAPGGVLLLTTTFTGDAANSYATERLMNGSRIATPTDLAGFEAAVGEPGVLPVCRFAEPWIVDKIEGHGFKVREAGCFHFAGEHDVKRDEANSADPACRTRARDAYYLCVRANGADSKNEESEAKYRAEGGAAGRSGSAAEGGYSASNWVAAKDGLATASPIVAGKVCFMQYYSLDSRAITDETIHRAGQLASAGDKAAELLHEFDVAEAFLYGSNLHFPARRFIFSGWSLHIRDLPIETSFAVLSLYPETGVCQICICLDVGDASADDYVYLHQVQGAKTVRFSVVREDASARVPSPSTWVGSLPARSDASILGLCDTILADLELEPIATDTAYLLEINRLNGADVPASLQDTERASLYGMLTGDEGWRHVPRDLVRARLENSWSTRDFARTVVFSNNFLLVNFNQGRTAANYLAGQRENGIAYYGGIKEYFTQDAHTAGLNHGVFFSAETGMLVKATTSRLLSRRPVGYTGRKRFSIGEIRKSKSYRGELIRTLSKLEIVSISEMGELDALVAEGLSVSRRVQSIRELLELVESELELAYDSNTNRMVGLLTVLGLLFALAQVVVASLALL